ncbi:MAG: hypothetical protein K2X47_06295, partial [Bdellovibrionales bacterium]|nr:hypothetical protein [Bdellovibrionales bacterium]
VGWSFTRRVLEGIRTILRRGASPLLPGRKRGEGQNGSIITKVIVDPHYEEKHARSISDEVVLALVKSLDGQRFEPDDEDPPYSYFVTDRIKYKGKFYKLIWLLEEHEIYIGVVNAYRR